MMRYRYPTMEFKNDLCESHIEHFQNTFYLVDGNN